MRRITFVFGALLTLTGMARAERVQYTYNGGDASLATSYSPQAVPVEGDQILVPADTDLVLTYGTPAWTAVTALGEAGHIVPVTETSRVILVVPEGESVEFPVPVSLWEYRPYFYQIDPYGALVKRGAGEVTLTATRMSYNGYNTSFSCNTVRCEEGTLSFALNNTADNVRLARLEVDAGATVNLGSKPAGRANTYCWRGFYGEGTITTKSTYVCPLLVGDNAAWPGLFTGRLTGNVYWQVQNGGYQTVLSDTCDFASEPTFYNRYWGVGKLGNSGEPSSIGTHYYIWIAQQGTTIEYFGPGETVGKNVVIAPGAGEPLTISAGPTGGVEFASFIYQGATSAFPPHLRLAGSNRLEAAVAGTIEHNKAGNSVYFSKIGSGAWRFKNHSGRLNANGFAVREGRLIFDSIAETNAFCSLGVATNLFDGDCSAGWTAGDHRTDIFLTLGSTNGNAAVFEYGGTNSQACSTRLIGLDGIGGHFRNDNPLTQIRWVGARAIEGTPTLTLDGASTKTNELADISDGTGTLGVRKEGAGTWKISGDTTFTGPLEVREGKLIVAAPVTNLYTWFRWTLRGHKPGTSSTNFQIEEFGLYNAANRRVNDCIGLSANGWGEMAPGEMALQWPGGVTYGNGGAGYGPLQDGWETELGLVDHQMRYGFNIFPKEFGSTVHSEPGLPTTHLPVVFRLDAEAMGEVKSWDYMNLWSAADGSAAWSTRLEGSVDGLHWEYLDENTEIDAETLTMSWMWVFKKEQRSYIDYNYDHAMHTGGREIAVTHSPRTYSVLTGHPEVSVAAGAVLEAEGEVEISKLAVDANGAGTIRGVRFAAEGSLAVTNLPRSGGEAELPLRLEACTGDLAGWSAKFDGAERPDWSILVANGRIVVRKQGLQLIIR